MRKVKSFRNHGCDVRYLIEHFWSRLSTLDAKMNQIFGFRVRDA
jgi:hypothetical protein